MPAPSAPCNASGAVPVPHTLGGTAAHAILAVPPPPTCDARDAVPVPHTTGGTAAHAGGVVPVPRTVGDTATHAALTGTTAGATAGMTASGTDASSAGGGRTSGGMRVDARDAMTGGLDRKDKRSTMDMLPRSTPKDADRDDSDGTRGAGAEPPTPDLDIVSGVGGCDRHNARTMNRHRHRNMIGHRL